jgi:hypothetical protein
MQTRDLLLAALWLAGTPSLAATPVQQKFEKKVARSAQPIPVFDAPGALVATQPCQDWTLLSR